MAGRARETSDLSRAKSAPKRVAAERRMERACPAKSGALGKCAYALSYQQPVDPAAQPQQLLTLLAAFAANNDSIT